MIKRLVVLGLIAGWLALGLAQALPHVHHGNEQPSTHPCVFCRVQSAIPLTETGPMLTGLSLANLPVWVLPSPIPPTPFTRFHSSRAPPALA